MFAESERRTNLHSANPRAATRASPRYSRCSQAAFDAEGRGTYVRRVACKKAKARLEPRWMLFRVRFFMFSLRGLHLPASFVTLHRPLHCLADPWISLSRASEGQANTFRETYNGSTFHWYALKIFAAWRTPWTLNWRDKISNARINAHTDKMDQRTQILSNWRFFLFFTCGFVIFQCRTIRRKIIFRIFSFSTRNNPDHGYLDHSVRSIHSIRDWLKMKGKYAGSVMRIFTRSWFALAVGIVSSRNFNSILISSKMRFSLYSKRISPHFTHYFRSRSTVKFPKTFPPIPQGGELKS